MQAYTYWKTHFHKKEFYNAMREVVNIFYYHIFFSLTQDSGAFQKMFTVICKIPFFVKMRVYNSMPDS